MTTIGKEKDGSKRYYTEDYGRVYPDNIKFTLAGERIRATGEDIKNYLNHVKFYKFAAQFVKGKKVVDVGCGSGYGCKLLKEHGATLVCGTDASEAAIAYAKDHYHLDADFVVQCITNLEKYQDKSFDVTISSEVLEHIKEYGKEEEAIKELKRVTKEGGLVIVATPNSELLGDHGFYFDELSSLFNKHFSKYVIFENALLPLTPQNRALWRERQAKGRVGVVVSQNIDLSETVLIYPAKHEIKTGISLGIYAFEHMKIDTTLLHNTHSWIVVAINTLE